MMKNPEQKFKSNGSMRYDLIFSRVAFSSIVTNFWQY